MHEITEQSRLKREQNVKNSTQLIKSKGLSYIPRNHGTHLTVYHLDLIAEFWPTTGIWKIRDRTKEGRGVFKLLNYLGVK